MSRVIPVYKLKPGDRFSFIPADWHGPGVVTVSEGNRSVMSGFSGHAAGLNGTHGTWTLKFLNNKVVNPPGLWYGNPDVKVRYLGRGLTKTMKRIKGRSY